MFMLPDVISILARKVIAPSLNSAARIRVKDRLSAMVGCAMGFPCRLCQCSAC